MNKKGLKEIESFYNLNKLVRQLSLEGILLVNLLLFSFLEKYGYIEGMLRV